MTSGDLIAHSLAVVCPSASALSTSFALAHLVGPGAWLSVVLGVGLSLVLAVTFGEFGSRFVAPGSLYTYAAKGLGTTVALMVGCSMLLGYGALVGYGLTDSGRQVQQAAEIGGVAAGGSALQVTVVAIGALLCLRVMRRGIRWSSRVAFTTEAVTLVTLVVVLILTASRNGIDLGRAFGLGDTDLHRVLVGAALVMTITVGFESSAALGVEARRPFLEVPRSMRTAVLISGGLVLGGVVASSGVEERTRGRWFDPQAQTSVLDALTHVVIAASYIALALCAWTALSRLLFAFGREGVLPGFLGGLHPGSGIPTTAIAITTPVVLLPTVVSLIRGEEPGWASYQLLVSATVILFVAYGITALAALPFLAKLGELTLRSALVALVALAGTAVMMGVQISEDVKRGEADVLISLGVVLAVAVVWRLVLGAARPGALSRVGTHEATLASEAVVPDDPVGTVDLGQLV